MRVGQLDESRTQDWQTDTTVAGFDHTPTVGVSSCFCELGSQSSTQHARTGCAEAQHAGFAAEASLVNSAWREHSTSSLGGFFTIVERLTIRSHADLTRIHSSVGCMEECSCTRQDVSSEHTRGSGLTVVQSHAVTTCGHRKHPVSLSRDTSICSVLVGDSLHRQSLGQSLSLQQRRCSRSHVRSRQVRQIIERCFDCRRSRNGTGSDTSSGLGSTNVGSTQQGISSERIDRCRTHCLCQLREHNKVTLSGRAICGRHHSGHSGSCAREGGCLGHVDDVPVTHQACSRRVETGLDSGFFGVILLQHDRFDHSCCARCHAIHVLDSSVQSRLGEIG